MHATHEARSIHAYHSNREVDDDTAVIARMLRPNVDSSTDVPVRTMPRKGIGPAVASLCSPVETKPAIVIIDGEQRRKAKKWASPDIVTFAA